MHIDGGKLRNLREQSGYTLVAFAKAAGISKSYLSHIERGERNPSPPTVQSLIRVLRVPIYFVLPEDGE